MTLGEAINNLGTSDLRRACWRADLSIMEWEEHMWMCAGQGYRLAPWCPCPDDITATDWEQIE